jgi:hypothetical protein
VDAHEFAAVFVASQRKFGAGKRFNQRFPNILHHKYGVINPEKSFSAPIKSTGKGFMAAKKVLDTCKNV